MPIIVNLDVMMAKRKISLNELSERVGLTLSNLSILKTVLEPTLNELAILGGIVVLRTVLSVFLNKEIKELETENKDTE